MEFEIARIAKVNGKCPACEDYADKNSTTPPKIAVMACEGACARGEVARRAANLVAHRLATDSTVRICLGGAFTKDTGQRNLVRRAERVIAIEGCFINCSSRMMQGVLPELEPEIVRADLIHNIDLPFGIDEVPDEMFTIYANQVAERVVQDSLTRVAPSASSRPPACGTGPAPSTCGCPVPPVSCCAGPGCSAGNSGAEVRPADVVDVQWDGKKTFRAENPRGGSLSVDDGSKSCTALEALMAALGGCVSSALLSQLAKDGAEVRAVGARVSGTRGTGLPAAYETIHIVFSLDVNRDDKIVEEMIKKAVTVLCPVAVTLGRAADLTWEFRRINAE